MRLEVNTLLSIVNTDMKFSSSTGFHNHTFSLHIMIHHKTNFITFKAKSFNQLFVVLKLHNRENSLHLLQYTKKDHLTKLREILLQRLLFLYPFQTALNTLNHIKRMEFLLQSCVQRDQFRGYSRKNLQ